MNFHVATILSRLCTAAFAVAMLLPAAQAQNVTTPVVSLIDSSADPLPFHLVSEIETAYDTQTRILFTGLPPLMQGELTVPPEVPEMNKSVSAMQSVSLVVNPHYELRDVSLIAEVTYSASGASYTDTSLTYSVRLFDDQNNFAEGALLVAASNSGHVPVYVGYLGAGEPIGNNKQFIIRFDGSMHVISAPWSGSAASFTTNSLSMMIRTVAITPVPEPASLPLMLGGLMVFGAAYARQRGSAAGSSLTIGHGLYHSWPSYCRACVRMSDLTPPFDLRTSARPHSNRRSRLARRRFHRQLPRL